MKTCEYLGCHRPATKTTVFYVHDIDKIPSPKTVLSSRRNICSIHWNQINKALGHVGMIKSVEEVYYQQKTDKIKNREKNKGG